MSNVQLEIRSPKNVIEIATFGDICGIVGVPPLLASMDGEKIRGLMALSQEVVIGGITYAVHLSNGNGIGKTASIDALAVHPDYQGRGAGKNLISSLLTTLKQEGVVEVTAVPLGTSKDFYDKCGFFPDYACVPVYMIKLLEHGSV